MGSRMMAVMPDMWARGAEICTLYLLTGLKAFGYQDLFFHAALGNVLPDSLQGHLLPRFQEVSIVSYGIHGAVNNLGDILAKRIAECKPEIVLYSFDKSIPCLAPSSKTVLVVHGIAPNDFDGYHPHNTDAVVCVSKYAASMAAGLGIPGQKIHFIPNGVPKAVGQRNRTGGLWNSVNGIPEDAWVWLFVGGLTRLKRPQLLIAALARRDQKDEYAIFAGEIDPGMRLSEYADALGVADRCVFLGHVDSIGDVYHSSDCLVVTSERESMPLIILEAMSAGLGIVANSVGGIPEILSSEFSRMYTEESGEAGLDEAMETMRRLDSTTSISAHAELHWLNNYNSHIMTLQYHDLFTRLLGR